MFYTRFGGIESELLMHWQQQQRRDLALADYMLTGAAQHLATIVELDAWMLDQAKPEIFDTGDPRNVLVVAKQRFLRLCAALESEGIANPQQLTLLEFHSRIEFLNEKYKKSE